MPEELTFGVQVLGKRYVTHILNYSCSSEVLSNNWMSADIIFQVYFEPDEVHACIVTCGGLCPGLNTVIREIVCGLSDMYGVERILGIEVGTFLSSLHCHVPY